ncbi:MAG: excinuclease ABC subunit UvrC [Rickettsiales bacterium]|jgi:excinuclease ABC subunit C|nr:excinuclease ABC subunit UvrC [Rickettsiales bacterium]
MKEPAGLKAVSEFQAGAPRLPGVYRMFDGVGRLLYVGKAKDLRQRLKNYTDIANLSERIAKMVSETRRMDIIRTNTENEALILEQDLIHRQKPKYNIMLRDDKSYPYLTLSRDEYPRLGKYRGARSARLMFFGPFPSNLAVNEGIKMMQSIFGLRTCSDAYMGNRRAPCLLYQIKKCAAPCCGRISRDGYAARAAEAVAFLKGKSNTLIDGLSEQMRASAEDKDYESAMYYRDQIGYLNQLLKKSSLSSLGQDTDVIALLERSGEYKIEVLFSRSSITQGNYSYTPLGARGSPHAEILAAFLERFYSENEIPKLILTNVDLGAPKGEIEESLGSLKGAKVSIEVPQRGVKKAALDTVVKNGLARLEQNLDAAAKGGEYMEALAKLFGLATVPGRIDVFDNSHISGTGKVGAMVVAGPRGFMRDDYRRYNISSTEKGDDIRMMEEVLTRRYSRAKAENTLPDLIIVDGGAPQVEAAFHALRRLELDVPTLGMAKSEGHDAGNETLLMRGHMPVKLDHDDPLLFYLERVRDEAHRYAITSHRRKREKSAVRSALDSIEGVGPAKKKALLNYFGSVRNIENSTAEELARVSGVDRRLAQKIYDSFH